MKIYYINILVLLFIISGCRDDNETPHKFYSISEITWMTYDTINSGLPDNFITNVEVDKDENIWIGTFAKGIARFNGSSWTVFNTNNSGLSNDSIWDMVFDDQNILWVGTGNGLTKFDGINWTIYNNKNSSLPVKHVSCTAIDKNNILWIGCGNANAGGLMKYDGNKWELFEPENSILPCRIINRIFIDKSNNKWIATGQYQGNGGIIEINGEDEEWTLFNMNNTIMPYNNADDITQGNDGNIWIAMTALLYDEPNVFEGSLLRYDGESFKEFKPHDFSGKLTNRVLNVRADNHNNIWITTMPESTTIEKYELAMFNGEEWFIASDLDTLFPSAFSMDLKFDSQERLWIGHTGLGLTNMEINFE